MEQSVQERKCDPHAAATQTRMESRPAHSHEHGEWGAAA